MHAVAIVGCRPPIVLRMADSPHAVTDASDIAAGRGVTFDRRALPRRPIAERVVEIVLGPGLALVVQLRRGPEGMVLADVARASARLRYDGPRRARIDCGRRRVWALRVVAGAGGRGATLTEHACAAEGADACEYALAWDAEPSPLPALVTATGAALVVLTAIAFTTVSPAVWLLVPAAAAAAHLLERRRAAGARAVGTESPSALRTLLDRASTADGPTAIADALPVLEQTGDFWRIAYAGTTVTLRHTRGLSLLAHLVRNPGTPIHVRDLDAITPSGGSSAARDAPAPDSAPPVPGDAGDVLDDRARREYRRRVTELQDEIADAERDHDADRAEALRAELELVADELRAATGVHGRSRRASADVERLRVAITRRIRAAIAQIAKHHEALGAHLDRAVSTGYACAYEPRDDDTRREPPR